ncbi:uncharacterized protein LOC143372613 isoform X1 [Andrena cerasifolii]|uniref:uncharacterized protein LOC143372613 isoform X1 n=1 Tax=Andrena cerasifolii TaxID=2819439 RepID=UPI004038440E
MIGKLQQYSANCDPDFLHAYMCENLNNTEAAAAVAQTPESEDQAPELEECSSRDSNIFEWEKNSHLLLDFYRKRLSKFRDPKVKKKEIWKEIVYIFKSKGFQNMDVDTLDRKMRNLKRIHKEIRDRNNQTGAERVSWEFHNIFEQIFANDKTINFGPIIASRAPCNIPPPLATPQYSDAYNSIQDRHTYTFSHCNNSEFSCIHHFIDITNDSDSAASQLDLHIADRSSISHTPLTSGSNSPIYSSTSHPNTIEVPRNRSLYSWRQKQFEIEEKRVVALENLNIKLEKSNKL